MYRAALPVITAVVNVGRIRQLPHMSETLSLCLLSTGVAMVLYQDHSSISLMGLVTACAGVASSNTSSSLTVLTFHHADL